MVAVLFAPGFEELEAIAPVDVLRRVGIEVKLAGVGGREITGSHGITVACDLTAEELDLAAVEMLVLPGGKPGAANLEGSQRVQECIAHCAEKGVWLAAICAAPAILGKAGLLKELRATCAPGYEQNLFGSVFTGEAVEVDGRVITGRGAGVAVEFSLVLAEVLKGRAAAEKISADMRCR